LTLITVLSMLLFGPGEGRCQTPRGREDKPTVAIEHVTVLPMTGVGALADMTVVIAGEWIQRMGKSATLKLPKSVRRVNGSDQWLLPALTDMHVHIAARPAADLPYGVADVLAPFVANGVLQIVDLASSPDTNQVRDRIAKGELDGPRIATCRLVDGDPPLAGPIASVVRTRADAEQVVIDIKRQGYDYIKVYSNLSLDSFQGVLAAARGRGLRVLGHFPGTQQASPADALLPGFALVAHAEEFAWHDWDWSDEEIAKHVQLMLARGAALTTTLYLDEQIAAQTRSLDVLEKVEGLARVNPAELSQWFESNRYAARSDPERIRKLEAGVEFMRRMVRAFVAAGVRVFAGTDSGVAGVAPGYSLHQELLALSRAGLTNAQILEAATVQPMRWLGVAGDRGTVEVGKRANLLLLSADPLAKIDNTRAISAVVHDGRVIPRAELDRRMAELDALYAPLRARFSPRAAALLDARARPL
jgi:Amidohydrolase family